MVGIFMRIGELRDRLFYFVIELKQIRCYYNVIWRDVMKCCGKEMYNNKNDYHCSVCGKRIFKGVIPSKCPVCNSQLYNNKTNVHCEKCGYRKPL